MEVVKGANGESDGSRLAPLSFSFGGLCQLVIGQEYHLLVTMGHRSLALVLLETIGSVVKRAGDVGIDIDIGCSTVSYVVTEWSRSILRGAGFS